MGNNPENCSWHQHQCYVECQRGNAVAGAELFVRQMSVGAQLQWPLAHDLAEGAVEAGPRFSVNAAYLF